MTRLDIRYARQRLELRSRQQYEALNFLRGFVPELRGRIVSVRRSMAEVALMLETQVRTRWCAVSWSVEFGCAFGGLIHAVAFVRPSWKHNAPTKSSGLTKMWLRCGSACRSKCWTALKAFTCNTTSTLLYVALSLLPWAGASMHSYLALLGSADCGRQRRRERRRTRFR